MNKKFLIVALVIVIAVGGWLWWDNAHQTLKPNTAASTGISLQFVPRLQSQGTLIVKDSDGKVVKKVNLAKNGDKYNLGIAPGVYTAQVTSPDQLFPPTPEITVTVTADKLSTATINMGSPEGI